MSRRKQRNPKPTLFTSVEDSEDHKQTSDEMKILKHIDQEMCVINHSDNEQPVLSTVRCDERPFSQSQPPYVWNYMSC